MQASNLSILVILLLFGVQSLQAASELFEKLYSGQEFSYSCEDPALPKNSREGKFRHKRSYIVSKTAKDNHASDDLTLNPGQERIHSVKVQYGFFGKDLEDEYVNLYYLNKQDCQFEKVGRARTNSDGIVNFKITAPERYGFHEFTARVDGDSTTVQFSAQVVPENQKFIIFDIDGTLTTGDGELIYQIFKKIFSSDYVPKEYEGAQKALRILKKRGYKFIYITGRPYPLHQITRDWLSSKGMIKGSLYLTKALNQSYPSKAGVGRFKRNRIQLLLADGHKIVHAFGNADTDIYAYLQAGISASNVHIIGKHAGEESTQPIASYPEYYDTLKKF